MPIKMAVSGLSFVMMGSGMAKKTRKITMILRGVYYKRQI